jgi:biotin transporter BioY
MNKKTSIDLNMGFPIVLFIMFLVLKLTHCIYWEWFYIFMPLWAPVAVFIVAILFFVGGLIKKNLR